MPQRPHSKSDDARDRVLECAEKLFMERGYESVKLRHIADELSVRAASLYYYFPNGKQEMFQAVLLRAMERIRAGLESAISCADEGLNARLRAAASYFLSQPKMDLYRMLESDLEQVDEEDRRGVAEALYGALQRPLIVVFRDAMPTSGNPGHGAGSGPPPPSPELLAGSFLASIQAVHHLRSDFRIPVSKEHMAGQVCDVLAAGVHALAGGCG
ncbi:MAG: TetR/AcrR family transcriptional regulator [Spirochaetales bacterium]